MLTAGSRPRVVGGLAGVLIGTLVLATWAVGVEELSALGPEAVSMKPNTAFSAVGLGLVLLLGGSADRRLRGVSTLLALAVGTLVILTLGEYLTGVDLGIDHVFFSEPSGAAGTSHPARMAPQTALSLMALAAAMPFVRGAGRGRLVAGLVAIPVLIGLLNIVATVLGGATPAFLQPYTKMAISTAALCVVLGLATVGALPGGGPFGFLSGSSPSAALARRLVVAAFTIPFALAWLFVSGYRAGFYDAAFGVGLAILICACLLVASIWVGMARLRTAEAERERTTMALAAALGEANDLYDHAPGGYLSLDADSEVVRINQTARGWLGYHGDAVVGRQLTDILTPGSGRAFEEQFHALRERGQTLELELDFVRRDGTILPTHLSATPVHDSDDQWVASRTTLIDISARREAEAAREALVRESERAASEHLDDLTALLSLARDLGRPAVAGDGRSAVCAAARKLTGADVSLFWEPDPGGVFMHASGSAGTGLPGGTLIAVPRHGSVPGAVLDGAGACFIGDLSTDNRIARELARRLDLRAGYWQPIVRDSTAAGQTATVGVLAVYWRDVRNDASPRLRTTIELFAAQAAAAIERGDLLARLDELARTDGLTGLANRRDFDARVVRDLSSAARTGLPLALVMLDLDHFKRFNDQHGHPAGDEFLRQVAVAWTAQLRPSDTLARYGGEEFAVVLPDCTGEMAVAIADRLRAVVPLGQTSSAGVALWDGREGPSELVGRADRALFGAKAEGRDCTVVATPSTPATPSEAEAVTPVTHIHRRSRPRTGGVEGDGRPLSNTSQQPDLMTG